MTDAKKTTDVIATSLADPARLAHNLAQVYERAARLAQLMAKTPDEQRQDSETQTVPMSQINRTLGEIWQAHLAQPEHLYEMQSKLWQQYNAIWNNAWSRAMGQQVEPVATPAKSDKRFKDKDWVENSIFDAVKQAYLVTSRAAQELVETADGVDPHTKQKAKFYVENIANAFSPTNSPLTNPEVIRATLATSGENLLKGMEKLETDLQKSKGALAHHTSGWNAV